MSNSRDEEARRRCEARAAWPIRRFDLANEPVDDLRATTTAGERLAMVWPLAVQAWRLAGREIPDYERSEAPGRVIRRGESAS